MHKLELKIPPPIVMLVFALLMWIAASWLSEKPWPASDFGQFLLSSWLAAALAPVGLLVIAAAVLEFRRHRTTVNPRAPTQSSCIVTSGIYRFSRNPMYLGMELLLIAWGLWLGQPMTLLGAPAFAICITLLQVRPEERALAEKFGAPYLAYCRQTPRWL